MVNAVVIAIFSMLLLLFIPSILILLYVNINREDD